MSPPPTTDERLRQRVRPPGRPFMRQVWRHLAFLHWPVAPATIARLLPPGLDVDTFDGTAYLGIVPFTIPLSRTPRLGLPVAPAFHEANLRTYVHRAGRDPGVWFFSLDAASRLAVAGARLAYHLPYFHARMSMTVEGQGAAAPDAISITYASRRVSSGPPAELRCRYRPTGPAFLAAPGTLELFLAERYLLYAWNGRALTTAQVHHPPYPLQPAAVTDITETLTLAASLPPTEAPPPLTHYVSEMDVLIWPPHRARP